MDAPYSYSVFQQVALLPDDWDRIAHRNLFLTRNYLSVLEQSAPKNMQCFFIGVFQSDQLVAVALVQFLDLSDVESFGDRDSCLKTKIRNVVFKHFSSRVLFLGNNMLTGQNALASDAPMTDHRIPQTLQSAIDELAAKLRPHLIVWKDFGPAHESWFKKGFEDFFRFRTQPNMVFEIPSGWNRFDDYLHALLKKYRDQYKRARKKAEGLEKRKLPLEEIMALQPQIYRLYRTVADKAPFNTFYLPHHHFATFKRLLGDRFLFYGYFESGQLVGFSTLIKNGPDIDTYFLGYDADCQREKMLYLNMLYDMTAYSVNNGYQRVIFARTALEIKSSVGARPTDAWGLIKHRNRIANFLMPKLFKYFEPELVWQQRHPFKD